MKLLLSFIFLLSSVLLTAQSGNNAFERQVNTSIKLYEMDAGQAVQYRQIMYDKSEDLNSLNKSAENYSKKLTEIENKYEKTLLSILNEKQQKIYRIQKAMRPTTGTAITGDGRNND